MNQLSDEEFATQALRSLHSVEISAELSRRVATIPIHHPHKQLWPWGRIWQPLMALGFSAFVGIYSGTLLEVTDGSSVSAGATSVSTPSASSSQATMDSGADEMLALYSFAWGQDWSELDEDDDAGTASTENTGSDLGNEGNTP